MKVDDTTYICIPRRYGKRYELAIRMIEHIRNGKKIRIYKKDGSHDTLAEPNDVMKWLEQYGK